MTGAADVVRLVLRESMRRNGDELSNPTEDELDHYESIRAVEVRVMALEQAQDKLNAKVDDNTRITASIKEDTGDLVEFAKATKGLVTFARWLGIFVKWGASIAAGAFALWSFTKGWK